MPKKMTELRLDREVRTLERALKKAVEFERTPLLGFDEASS